MDTVTLSWCAAVAAALLYGVGAVLQGIGARIARPVPGVHATFRRIVRQPKYLAGLSIDLLAWILTIAALQQLPVFAVQTIVASSLAVTVVLAHFVHGATLRPIDVAAIVGTVTSLVLVGAAAGSEPPGSPSTAVAVALIVGAPAVAVVSLLTSSASTRVSSTIAGTAFAGSMLAARATHFDDGVLTIAVRPLSWAAIAYGLVGLVSYARAVEAGDVGSATASTWATEIVIASLAGRTILGDHTRQGWQWVATAGLALALLSTFSLARSNARTTTSNAPKRGLPGFS